MANEAMNTGPQHGRIIPEEAVSVGPAALPAHAQEMVALFRAVVPRRCLA
jgi:hypothetical protein